MQIGAVIVSSFYYMKKSCRNCVGFFYFIFPFWWQELFTFLWCLPMYLQKEGWNLQLVRRTYCHCLKNRVWLSIYLFLVQLLINNDYPERYIYIYFLISRTTLKSSASFMLRRTLFWKHAHAPTFSLLCPFFAGGRALPYTQKKPKGHTSFHHLTPLVCMIHFLQSCLKKTFSMLSSEGLIKTLQPQTWQ